MKTVADRIKDANEFIGVIASCGRKFFEYEGRIARIERDMSNRLWWVDHYTQKPINIDKSRGEWRGFTGGGTLRAVIEAVVKFIKEGEPVIHPSHLNEKHWVYGGEMHKVCEAGIRLGIVKPLEVDCG